jgi:alkylated DNA repair dioxygenase AlkB
MKPPSAQHELFASTHLPDGFVYENDFLSHDEEEHLVTEIKRLPLQQALYRAFAAKRRIMSFGAGYDFSSNRPTVAPPIAAWLMTVRERAAAWANVSDELSQCTIAEYAAGTQLGWHRDVPTFGTVIGISLGSACRMRLRPYPHVKHKTSSSLVLSLEPRSIYVLRGPARWRWQHAISPTKKLRYSVTFRTIRRDSQPSRS